MRPKLLDLFCGAGGAAMGYYRAGFEVVGVDIKPQKHYPFHFILDDALTFLDEADLSGFTAIHASPPCQAYSSSTRALRNSGKLYPNLVDPTRYRLLNSRKLYVIENVPGAPIRADYRLCGCQVGLNLRRERWFETSWEGFGWSASHVHSGPVVSVVGHASPSSVRKALGYNPSLRDWQKAMGIDWMNRDELSQAIPPAYTEYIGKQLLEAIG